MRTPFGTPVVPGGVELQHDVAGLAAAARVDRLVGGEPLLVLRRRRGRPAAAAASGATTVGRGLLVFRPGDDERCPRVLEHRPQLGDGEPPVERHGDGADLARREQELDDLRRRAIEVGDPRAGLGPVREQGLGEPVRALVEQRVGELPLALLDGDGRRPLRGVLAHDVRDPQVCSAQHRRHPPLPAGQRLSVERRLTRD